MRGIVAVFLLALGLTAGASEFPSPVKSNTRAFEEIIESAIECVRDLMYNGWEDYDLPHWNPLIIDDLELDFSIAQVEGLTGNLHIQDATVANIPTFVVDSVSGTIGLIPPAYTVNVVLKFDRIDLESKYDIELTYGDYNLFGAGDIKAGALDSSIDLSTKATILGGISLEYFDLWLDMNGLNYFEVTGVRDDEDYSKEVTDYVVENWAAVVAGLAPTVHDIASEAAMNLVNNGDLGEEGSILSDLIDKCLGSR